MGQTLTIQGIPEDLTTDDLLAELEVFKEKVQITLTGGKLEVRELPDCWVNVFCKRIGKRIGRTLDPQDKGLLERNGIIREGDYILVSVIEGGGASATISSIGNGIAYISCDSQGSDVKVPVSKIEPFDNQTSLTWSIDITCWTMHDANDNNLVLKDKDVITITRDGTTTETPITIRGYENTIIATEDGKEFEIDPRRLIWDETTGKYKVTLED